ncbi:MAG TPA: sigma-54 dependent transcriptional regulator, partial [Polyangiaceae bacterium]|nr:sigma-54 dependent transcriptional regulator [Polyangiaceae bacterium]
VKPAVRLRAGVASSAPASSGHELLARAIQANRTATEQQPVRLSPATTGEATTTCIARSPAMQAAVELAKRVAAFDLPLLVHGETGSGKEVIARLIHDGSPRKRKPLVVVNCAAIPETLAESTLFGHEKGAFTGASARMLGAFERADGGTLFLDEVGELSGPTQADLLRVLESGSFSRVGSSSEIKVDVRVVAATHRSLEEMVVAGRFREDLLYRLNAVVIEVPPLRGRSDDIDALCDAFLAEFSRSAKLERTISEDARQRLRRYAWPGNVRELKNVIERASVLCAAGSIEIEDLPKALQRNSDTEPTLPPLAEEGESQATGSLALKDRVRGFEAELIRDALGRAQGNRSKAAGLLGIPLRTLNHKMKQLGIK